MVEVGGDIGVESEVCEDSGCSLRIDMGVVSDEVSKLGLSCWGVYWEVRLKRVDDAKALNE